GDAVRDGDGGGAGRRGGAGRAHGEDPSRPPPERRGHGSGDASGLPPLGDAPRDAMHEERADCMLGPQRPAGREPRALVGANVAEQRVRRAIDLATLAARTAIRPDLLALLESGRAVPSLRALWALATGLEVPFGSLLVRADTPPAAFRVQPAARGRVI